MVIDILDQATVLINIKPSNAYPFPGDETIPQTPYR